MSLVDFTKANEEKKAMARQQVVYAQSVVESLALNTRTCIIEIIKLITNNYLPSKSTVLDFYKNPNPFGDILTVVDDEKEPSIYLGNDVKTINNLLREHGKQALETFYGANTPVYLHYIYHFPEDARDIDSAKICIGIDTSMI